MLHKCLSGSFSWLTRFKGWPGKVDTNLESNIATSHITEHTTHLQLPPSLPPSLPHPAPPPPLPPQTMSASEASGDDFNEYALDHMPMPDFKALARDIQNPASCHIGTATTKMWHFREFSGRVCSSSKKNMGVAQERLPTFPGHGIVCNTTTTMNFPTHY